MRVQSTALGQENVKGLSRWLTYIARAINKNISYGSTMDNTDGDMNLDIFKATGDAPGTANTEFAIAHTLGRQPITIVGQDTNNGGLLYRSTTTWTDTHIYLKCTQASSVYRVIVA
jgi:hypothetical protein